MLAVVEKQHIPEIKKTASKEKFSCLQWTINVGKKVCVTFRTDTDKKNSFVYRYRNIFLPHR